MNLGEFDIIKQYFLNQPLHRQDVILGIGDDGAITQPPSGKQLVTSIDTLVNGIHFPLTTTPNDIGYKALAVNLSDLAAMGATPAWMTLALTLPEANPSWLNSFCQGLFTLAKQYEVQLIGGDTTRGPLTITIQVNGFVEANRAIRRDQAQPGDFIYVSNTLGDAAFGLQCLTQSLDSNRYTYFYSKLNRPEPQIELGKKLMGLATAAIDISDGLYADLSHILEKSQVGATLWVDQLPLSDELLSVMKREQAVPFALSGGDDYELCFTLPPHQSLPIGSHCTHIGIITAESGLTLLNPPTQLSANLQGYHHF